MKKLMMLLIAMINIFAFTSCNNEVADGSSTDESKNFERGWYTYTVTHDDEVVSKYYFLYNKKKRCINGGTEENQLGDPGSVLSELEQYDFNIVSNSVCDTIKNGVHVKITLEKTAKEVLESLSWYLEPTFTEDDLNFEEGWWEFGEYVNGKEKAFSQYFLLNSKKEPLKFFNINKNNPDENSEVEETILKNLKLQGHSDFWDFQLYGFYYYDPYFNQDGEICDKFLRKVSEKDLPEFIKNSI